MTAEPPGWPCTRWSDAAIPPPEYSRWTATTLTVQADGPVMAGIDGEPATPESPLRFATRPGPLIVRLPAGPGRGPARRLVEESRQLVRAALGGNHRG